MQIKTKHLEALSALCEAFIPRMETPQNSPHPTYWKTSAKDFDIAEKIIEIIETLSLEEQKDFQELLDLIVSPKLGVTWLGALTGAQNLSLEKREKLLKSWSNSRISDLRKAFGTLKKLCTFLFYSYANDDIPNPSWAAIGYPGPLGTPPEHHEIPTYQIETLGYLTCDTVIIGSGAGGSVVAAELSAAGHEVILLEKGQYIPHAENTQREGEMLKALYEKKGALSSKDGGVAVLAGSCLGGGTTVNWSGSFRTPDFVLEEWAKEHNNPQFLDSDYIKCFEAIEKRLSIGANKAPHNLQNKKLMVAGVQMGYDMKAIAQNVKMRGNDDIYWKSLSYGTIGDSFGQKQGAVETFLQDAEKNGCQIFINAEVLTIDYKNGEVTGVTGYQLDDEGEKTPLKIKAKNVVVSGGAIHTPAILKRSGLLHKEIGNNLYLHPVVPVSATYNEKIEAWYGPMMTAVCDQFTRLDGNFGFKIETPPVHSGLAAMSMPWEGGEQFKSAMTQLPHFGIFFPLVRDKFGGKITLNRQKQPVVHYEISDYDKKHLIRGMKECAKLHEVAGAKEIFILHNSGLKYNTSLNNSTTFIKNIAKLKWQPNYYTMYSAHQMGTCRMGGNNDRYPVQPNGETREIKNLYVADASLFPQCSGSNPMLSIQALSYYVAQQIK